MKLLPWSIEFDKGEALGNGLIKVVVCQGQQAGLQREKKLLILNCAEL